MPVETMGGFGIIGNNTGDCFEDAMESGGELSRAALLAEIERCRERIRNLKDCFRVSALINSSLEIDEVLEYIMTTCREILKADACSLMLADERANELVFTVAQGPVAGMLKSGFRLKRGEGIAGYVFETGESVLIEDAYTDPRFHHDFDRRTGYRTRSLLCVPLMAKGRIIGVAQVINRLDGAPFDAEDEEALNLLCAHAGVAIETARMHRALLRRQQVESDLAFANIVQRSFLPQHVPSVPGFRFCAHYRAALEVGGDFYDFIPLDGDHLGILIGDVSGKGVASALCMARLTSNIHLLAIRESEPGRLVEQVNGYLCEQSCRGMFATLLYMVLDPRERTVTYANAGHLPPLLWNAGEDRYRMVRDCGGPPVGILAARNYDSSTIRLADGDCLLLFTDGLTDAKNSAGERLGWDRLEAAVRRCGSGVEALRDGLEEALREFVRECPPADDTTMVLVGVEP